MNNPLQDVSQGFYIILEDLDNQQDVKLTFF